MEQFASTNTGTIFGGTVSQANLASLRIHIGALAIRGTGVNQPIYFGTNNALAMTINGSNQNVVIEQDLNADKMAVGSNSFIGLSSGDINVSTVYYDTLAPKSPIVFELEDGVILTKVQGRDWVECNPLIKEDCPIEAENKMKRIYDERAAYALLEAEISACELSNYSWDGECFETVTTETNYGSAVEVVQVNETIMVEENCLRLNAEFQVEVYVCEKRIETGELINRYQFKEGCDWNEDIGYYCESRMLRN
jgi:hypothetical protein